MRDLLLTAIVVTGCIWSLRRPWIGALMWTWLSLMNPHRYTYGFAYHAPLAMMCALCTFAGLVATRDRESPFKGTPVTLLAMFVLWMNLSWLAGLDPAEDYYQWSKVMKIDLMIFVGLALMRTKQHILMLACVTSASLAVLGMKGGLFTILHGGEFRVWGPAGSFIEDNNEFALALVMTIPLLRFIQMQLQAQRAKQVLTVAMVLCAAAAIGSHSRGALIAILAMGTLLWWRGRGGLLGSMLIVLVGVVLVMFMPEEWTQRMETIGHYEDDGSAMGRINAWWVAWNIALHYPFGVGFNAVRPELFAQYAPNPNSVLAAHSIYFQVLGSHGFIGLFIFVAMWISTWRWAGKLRREAMQHAQSAWCADLASMCQVSLLGFAVGGTFLSLAYFDLPYCVMMMTVLARRWVASRAWEHEPPYTLDWLAQWRKRAPIAPVA